MADINLGNDISPFADISYATTGITKGTGGISLVLGAGTGPQVLQTEAGVTLTTEGGAAIQTET